MADSILIPVSGIVQAISPANDDCCSQTVSLRNSEGITNFILSPATYVVQEAQLRIGMSVTAFYDSSLPVPLIYPPQYQAVIVGRKNRDENLFAGYFNEDLVSEDGSLQLNLARSTEIVTSNGQRFQCDPAGRLLLVYYTNTTRSIPPQTTPRKIIVIC